MTKLKPNQFILDGNLIQEYPLLFQAEMVDATLDERKTQTRREKGLEMRNDNPDSWTREGAKDIKLSAYFDLNGEKKLLHYANAFQFIPKSPREEKEYYTRPHYGKPGDLLWVRETWCEMSTASMEKDNGIRFLASTGKNNFTWKPSIHMPKSVSRIWLMIEDIYPERLQDISEEDAILEGILSRINSPINSFSRRLLTFFDYGIKSFPSFGKILPKDSFETLWISINGKDSWESNPWVWVIIFRVLSKTGRPSDEIILENHLQIIKEEVVNG